MTSHIHALPNKVCSSCAQPETTNSGKLKTCGKCHFVYYCSPSCQKTDWPDHKEKCKEYVKEYQKLTKDACTKKLSKSLTKEIRIITSYRNALHLPHAQFPIEDALLNQLDRLTHLLDFIDSKNNQAGDVSKNK
jgi:MYND finger